MQSKTEAESYDGYGERLEEKLAENPFQRDEAFIQRLLPLMDRFASYFDAEVAGFDTLPEQGPMLLVGNHSGGIIASGYFVMMTWAIAFKYEISPLIVGKW